MSNGALWFPWVSRHYSGVTLQWQAESFLFSGIAENDGANQGAVEPVAARRGLESDSQVAGGVVKARPFVVLAFDESALGLFQRGQGRFPAGDLGKVAGAGMNGDASRGHGDCPSFSTAELPCPFLSRFSS